MILNWIKKVWEFFNKISPETRTVIIMILFGYILYSQINESTQRFIFEQAFNITKEEKKAEQYTKDTALEVNRYVRLIAHRDDDAFNVLLLSYHNSKSSLSGYKFLYLSCIAECPKFIDTPLIGNQWTNLDYIYYIDELERIHNQEVLKIPDIEQMKYSLPKLYRLIKSSDAKSAAFYVIEGKNSPIGILVTLYKDTQDANVNKSQIIMPSIQKLAILLDYENK